jgi:cysteine desulfurase
MTDRPRAYLDHNATSPLRPQARAAMLAAMDTLGNPSSVHAEGRAARAMVEDARAVIARGIGTAARNLVFTSGATEAANLALTPSLQTGRESAPYEVLLTGAGEHPAVLSGHRFPAEAAERIALTSEGELSLAALEDALARHAGRRVMLALQAANNETGVLQPVAEAAALVHAAGGVLVCDATQTVGRVETSFATTGADILFFSSHKLGGPMGAGALAFACENLHIREPLLRGGGQEGGRRAGTENVAGVAGFAAACAAAASGGDSGRLAPMRDDIERRVREISPDARFLGAGARRLANVSAFVIPGVSARTLVMALDLEGVAVSSGSACSSGKARASHVLEAMGFTEKEALRVSLGWSSRQDDVEQFGMVLAKAVDRIRSRRPAA